MNLKTRGHYWITSVGVWKGSDLIPEFTPIVTYKDGHVGVRDLKDFLRKFIR